MGQSDTEAGEASSTQPHHIVRDSPAQLPVTQKEGEFSGLGLLCVHVPHFRMVVISLEMPEKK